MNCLSRILLVLALGMSSTSAFGVTYEALLSGAFENPVNASPALGDATITILGNQMTVDVNFSGLVGGAASAAHIHCCIVRPTTTSVAVGFPGFPNATSGTYNHVFDLTDSSIYTGGFLTANGGTAAGAQAALLAALSNWADITKPQSYVNIHNSQFPGGEIRGFPVLVPEPASIMLVAAGLAAVAMRRRRAS